MDRRLRNRLIVSQLTLWILIAVMLVIATVTVRTASRGHEQARDLAEHVVLADGFRVDMRKFVEYGRRYLLTGDPRDRARAKELEIQIGASSARIARNARQLDSEARATRFENAFHAVTSRVVETMVGRPSKEDVRPFESSELLERVLAFESELATSLRSLDSALADVRTTQHEAMTMMFDRSDQLTRRAQWTVLVVALLSLALGAAFTIAVLRELSRQSHQTRVASELARRIAASRRDLIAASHDLRTPLTTIIDRSASLRKLKLRDPEELEALTSITTAAKRVDELLVSLLDVSRLQNGNVALRSERCAADFLVERATRALGRTANERAIRLRSEACPITVYADSQRVVQVLTMLIELAMTPARAGSEITVSASPSEGAVRFEITTNQAGALPESISRMFGSDVDPEPPTDRARLEVYLCRRVIEAHGGRMGVQLNSDRATSCWFELPLEPRLLT